MCSSSNAVPTPLQADRTFNASVEFVTSFLFEATFLKRNSLQILCVLSLLSHWHTLTGKRGNHPSICVADFLHTGVKTEDYERIGRYLHHKMQGDVYSVRSIEGSTLIMTGTNLGKLT